MLVSGLVVNVYLAVVARSLTPAEYAGFGAFWGIALFVGFGAFLPLEQVLAQQLPRPQDRRALLRAAVGAALLLTALTLVALSALSGVALSALDGDVSAFLALVVLCVVSAAQFLLRGLLIGTDRLVWHGGTMVVDACLRLALATALFLAGGATVAAFCWALVAAIAVAHLPQLPPVWRRTVAAGPDPELRRTGSVTTRVMLRSTLPLLAGSVCAQVLLNGLPILVVARAAPADQAAAGVFLAAFTLARAPLAMVVPLQSAVVPALTRMIAAGHRRDVTVLLVKGALGLAAVAAVAVPLAWWIGPALVRLVLGGAYLIRGVDLALITGGVLAYVALVVVTQVHVARARPSDVATSWTLALVTAAVAFWALPGPVVNAEVAFLAGSAAGALAGAARLATGPGRVRAGRRR